MSRATKIALIALGVVVFLAISIELGRFFGAESAERGAVFTILKAEARGDAASMLRHMPKCARKPRCAAEQRANARRLRRPGSVKILAYNSPTAYALGSASGLTRVAWESLGHSRPIVQCARIVRTGNALYGRAIHVVGLSRRIDSTGDC